MIEFSNDKPDNTIGSNRLAARADSIANLPILPVMSSIIFPEMIASLQIEAKENQKLIERVNDGDTVGLVLAKTTTISNQPVKDLYRVGITARLLNRMKVSDKIYQLYLQGLNRMMVETFTSREPFIQANVKVLKESIIPEDSLIGLRERVIANLEQFVTHAPRVPNDAVRLIKMNANSSGQLADMIACNIPFELRDQQQIIEAIDIEHRLTIILEMLEREIANISVMNEISTLAKKEIDSQQRKMFLRRQLRTIQKELGEDPEQQRIVELKERIAQTKMPDPVLLKVEKEISRMESMSSSFSEYNVIINYLEWILDLPWNLATEDNLDLLQARDVLDRHHFGLDDVKERILEFLAVRYLRKEIQGPVLCFSGPPGVGKTSLGKAIAEALGRRFVRMSVGGMRDESEIRGHRRTYVGAMPGRIVQNLRQAESNNPVFMIDEIDKMGSDYRGDPSAALLEVLDPEQNHEFLDHYLDIPIDLTKVFFIATANVLPNIPPALRDRMEVIKLPGYTENEKKEIAKRHLFPRQRQASGLTKDDLALSDNALYSIIRGYTREAGVRNLERQLANICRKTAKEIVSGKPGPFKIDVHKVEKMLGPEQFIREAASAEDAVGVATALAWSEAGGEILFVEALKIPGGGRVKVTGQIGDVMRESAEAALSFIKNHYEEIGINKKIFSEYDIHLHIPEGAVPKDGPSAGIALASAIASLLSERPIDHTIAMTGEITLTGKVLAIGGLKEKGIAAHRAGISTVIIPERNEAVLGQMPDEVKKAIKFVPVSRLTEALDFLLK